jgi:hypothetical protein
LKTVCLHRLDFLVFYNLYREARACDTSKV